MLVVFIRDLLRGEVKIIGWNEVCRLFMDFIYDFCVSNLIVALVVCGLVGNRSFVENSFINVYIGFFLYCNKWINVWKIWFLKIDVYRKIIRILDFYCDINY